VPKRHTESQFGTGLQLGIGDATRESVASGPPVPNGPPTPEEDDLRLDGGLFGQREMNPEGRPLPFDGGKPDLAV